MDLSRHLLTLEQLQSPFLSEQVFPRAGALEIEVGSGKGLFLETAAAQVPAHNFLGCEVAHKYARHAAARLARAGLTNAAVVDGDAQRLFAEYLPIGCAAGVHIYFPDPWWKKRHRKRRIMNGGFLKQVQRVLQPGGQLHFWTDVEEYFQESLQVIAASTELEGPFAQAERDPEHDLDYRTHFERRMRQHEVAVHRAWFVAPPLPEVNA